MKKKMYTTIFFVMICVFLCSTVFASGLLPDVSYDPPDTDMENMSNDLLGVVQVFSFAILVGMIMYIGIKYMHSPANERADLKSGSIKYVAGAIIVFAAATIFKNLWTIFSDI